MGDQQINFFLMLKATQLRRLRNFCLGWLPYARRELSDFMLAPRLMSTRGGTPKPKLLATFFKSRLCTSKMERSECDA